MNDSSIPLEAQTARPMWMPLLAGAALLLLALLVLFARATPAHAQTADTTPASGTTSATPTDTTSSTPTGAPSATPTDPTSTPVATAPGGTTPTGPPAPPPPADPGPVVTPAPVPPAAPTPPVDPVASTPNKHPPVSTDATPTPTPTPTPSSDPMSPTASTTNSPTVTAPATPDLVSALVDPNALATPPARGAERARSAPSRVMPAAPITGAPAPSSPDTPVPVAPQPAHTPESPLGFEAGGSTSSSSPHGSGNTLMLAAVLVLLGILLGPEIQRLSRFTSVPPRLDFAFAFERPG